MQQDFNQKRKHPGQTGLFMGSWPVMKDLTGFFLLISSSRNGPNRRLNNNRKTSALMPETKTLTEDPTIQRDPPPPPPYLSWREPHSRPWEPPDHSSPSHYTSRFHCFLQFPCLEALVMVTITLVAWLYFYFFPSVYRSVKVFFNFEVQWALAALMSLTPAVKRTAGLYITDEVVFTQLP